MNSKHKLLLTAIISGLLSSAILLSNEFYFKSTEANLFAYLLFLISISIFIYWFLLIKELKIDESLLQYKKSYRQNLSDLDDSITKIDEIILDSKHLPTEDEDLSKFHRRRIIECFDLIDYEHLIEPQIEPKIIDFNKKASIDIFIDYLNRCRNRILKEKENKQAERFSSNINEKEEVVTYENINPLANSTIRRLEIEIEYLSRTSTIYLIIGSGITIFAGGALFYFISDLINKSMISPSTSDSTVNFASAVFIVNNLYPIVGKLLLILFIESFAFYFLKLFKNNIDLKKYYLNELTNIESKIISLYASIFHGKANSFDAIVLEFAKTERNKILLKGETTVDIEKFKIESSQIGKILLYLKKLKF
ncbi:hypothetical protein [Leptospira bandrabouensis]|uniref:Uncharacterized protein n=1 Tax=Leptospira bandrabouensis TaxID=2484903 RepID=A0A6H3P4W2_9LEPT|nr:hypothetical protein [Leptospira bandrabouensis]TGN16853.1 hypothetical protein EHR08_00055 [Leptospira bandrabouensis]